MEIVVSPVGIKGPFSITCLDTWANKLILGTSYQGVLVYDISSYPSEHDGSAPNLHNTSPQNYSAKMGGEYLAVVNSIQTEVANGKNPIVQLHIVDRLNCLFVLSGGIVSVYSIKVATSGRVSFTLYYTLPTGLVDRYCFNKDSIPTICLATVSGIFLYHIGQSAFSLRTKVDFEHEVLDMVLAGQKLFLVYKDERYCVSCYNLADETFEHNIYSSESPILAYSFGEDGVLFRSETTNQIFSSTTSKEAPQSFSTKIVIPHGQAIAIIDHQESEGISNETLIDFASEPLQFITTKNHVYVASAHAVWRLTLPFSLLSPGPPLSQSFYPSPTVSLLPPSASTKKAGPTSSTTIPGYNPRYPKSLLGHVTPRSTLAEAGLAAEDVEKLALYGIFTVSQINEIPTDAALGPTFWSWYYCAKMLLSSHNELNRPTDYQEPVALPQIKPDDLLEAIGVETKQIETLSNSLVFTIRQYALLSETAVLSYGKEFLPKHKEAVQIVDKHAQNTPDPQALTPKNEIAYGYLYVTKNEYANIIENRAVKSAYVLFQEYVDSEAEARINHPWKEVHKKFQKEAIASVHASKKEFDPKDPVPLLEQNAFRGWLGERDISDADVFSYLNWRFVSSIGQMDVTAGSRAISFCIRRYESKPFEKNRNNNLVKINLTSLCNKYGGKIFHKKKGENGVIGWTGVNLEQQILAKNRYNYYYESQKIDETVSSPHACIVLPTGIIPWDCIVLAVD